MHLARKSRLAGVEKRSEAGKWVAGRMALLFTKTQLRCEEIYRAMRGEAFPGRSGFMDFDAERLNWFAGGNCSWWECFLY